MDEPLEPKVVADRTDVPAVELSEISPEQLQQVAGGQDGTAHAKQR